MPDPGAVKGTGSQRVICAVYLRVSTVDQGRHGFSIQEQRRACLEKAAALARGQQADPGGPVALETFEFVDTAGGDLLERPELDRLRRFVREARPQFLVCLDPDRFSRATYQAILIATEIEAAGTRLEFVQHDYQTTSEGRLFFTLRVAIAEYEKAKILERTARGKRGKLAAGEIPHNIQVFGYHRVAVAERQLRVRGGHPDPGPLEVNPAEAAWVRQIFAWVADERIGSQAITERLNRMGVPAKHGGLWRRGVVAFLLRNPIYMGQLRLNRYDSTGLGAQLQLPRERRTRKITARLRPRSEWILVRVPAIISAELFAAAQAALEAARGRSGSRPPSGRPGRLLSGLLRCGLCGAAMHYVWNNSINSYLVRCANRYPEPGCLRAPAPSRRCQHPYQKASQFERQTWDRVRGWCVDPDLLRAYLEQRSAELETGRQSPDSRPELLEQQIGEARKRQARIVNLVGKGVVDPELAEAQLAALRRQVDRLEQERRRLHLRREQAALPVCPRGEGAGVVEVARQALLDSMDELSLSEGQTAIRMVVREVRVFPCGRCEVLPIGDP